MNRKAFGILIAVACIAIVLAILGQGRVGSGSIAGGSAGTLLLPGLTDDIDALERILIDGAGRQRLVSLEFNDGEWDVAEAGGYQADRSLVNALLIALAEARIVEEKTANPALHSRLGVEAIDADDAAGLQITLAAADGDAYSVVLGADYNASDVYARLPDSDQSVQVDRNPDIGRDPSDWVVKEILDIDSNRVQRVEIMHADGEHLIIAKAARDEGNFSVEDIPEGRELQYAGVANVTANLLQALRLDAVEPAGDDGDISVTTEFWMFDGLVVTVNTVTEDEASWLTFSARFDLEQALEFADQLVTENLAATDQDDSSTSVADAVETADDDAIAEAQVLDSRLADWRYRIPEFQMSQLTRRMDDLLRAETAE